MKKVEKGATIKVHYKGTLNNGELFDTSENREPLQFCVGDGSMIQGFDAGVVGMELNETKTITIPCNEAYGEVRNELLYEVDKSQMPPDVKVGMDLVSQEKDGQQMRVKVAEIKDTSVIVDANHPLAGNDLTFEMTVVEIS